MASKTLKHIAIIMDGNGRWAKKHAQPRLYGHAKGAETVKTIVKACIKHNIPYLTLFAFSTENWNRPEDEVEGLMNLLVETVHRERQELIQNGVRFRSIGDITAFPSHVKELIQDLEQKTRQGNRLFLNIALNYGARAEILHAVKEICKDIQANKLSIDRIDENIFSSYLMTHAIPDPDLLIRTSGEMRISNFLLWQLAYTELYFTPVCWPDFDEKEFEKAILEYYSRERRFGKISEQLNNNNE